VGVTDCTSEKAYIYDVNNYKILAGKCYFDGTDVVFPSTILPPYGEWEQSHTDGSYRTVWGGVAHNGVILGNNVRNLQGAVRRMLNVRDPTRPDCGAGLRSNQITWFRDHPKFLLELRRIMSEDFEFDGTYEEALKHVGDPHPKQALRIQAFKDLFESGRIFGYDWRRHDRDYVLYKAKKDEIAKPNKWQRAIGDLGVGCSLVGFVVTKIIKCRMAAEPIRFHDALFEFCASPDQYSLERAFARLNSPSSMYFIYFSDDSCLSIRDHRGRVFRFNLDISGCDASHGPAVFKTLVNMVPKKARGCMEQLVQQCKRPFQVRSPENRKHKIVFQSKTPKMFSGATITTAINNVATVSSAWSIHESLEEIRNALDVIKLPEDLSDRKAVELSMLPAVRLIQAATERVGYVVTVDCCPLHEQLQFLKHSPILDTEGVYRPVLNLGVVLRSSHTCHGDLPGRGDIMVRADAFQCALLNGLSPTVSSDVIQALKASCGEATTEQARKAVKKQLAHKFGGYTHDESYPSFQVDEESQCRRYGLKSEEMEKLVENCGAGYGYMWAGGAADTILNLDYGLRSTPSRPTTAGW